MTFTLDDFDYDLPESQIAQTPLEQRDKSRLLHLNRESGETSHLVFHDILDFLNPGDILVLNNSRVIPARLFGEKRSGGKVELLLLKEGSDQTWQALVGGKRLVEGTDILLHAGDGTLSDVVGTVVAQGEGAIRHITFNRSISEWLADYGHTPLPPYIQGYEGDSERYQTVYNRVEGSAAAPTAGLHFTNDLLFSLHKKGIHIEYVTLHVGLDTFKPVTISDIENHHIHSETISIDAETARRINEAKLAGGRIIGVGTTSVRTLESAALRSAGIKGSLQQISTSDRRGETSNACPWKPVIAYTGPTDLYIYPGYRFRAVDGMITNFHMPKSTLMMMVSAFAGRDHIMRAYAEARENGYRFLSFGDAMYIA